MENLCQSCRQAPCEEGDIFCQNCRNIINSLKVDRSKSNGNNKNKTSFLMSENEYKK